MKAIVFFICLFVAACSFLNVFDTTGGVDQENGVILDTSNNRKFFTFRYDRMIRAEVQGEPPAPAYQDWSEVWRSTFSAIRSGHNENPDFYINYIREKRAEKGLDPI